MFGAQLRVPHLIDDQHTGRGIAAESLPSQTWIGCRLQGLGKLRERGKQHGVACGERFHREGDAQVRFADSRRPKKQHVGRRFHKREIRQFPQQPF
ncbi:MAG TPA: hypothetical protein VKY19_11070 [Ktedonosporobacter sp.]|nr:hypothetical protein [Ktedonosporobacter sp.]